MQKKCALIIFARAPVLGQVKTRLIPGVGQRKATSIYKKLLSKTIALARKSDFSSIQVWVDGDIQHEYFKQLKKRYGFKIYRQTGRDLGMRMSNSFHTILRNYPIAILIGSDCPELTLYDLRQAQRYLENDHDVVLGPAEDGGYYLIGLKKNEYCLFQNIKWGNDTVIAETCSRINMLNLKLQLLPVHRDVDRVSDLFHYFRNRNNLY